MKERSEVGNGLQSDSSGLMRDAVNGDTILTMCGKNRMYVQNYRSILIYSENSLQIRAKKYKLTITGKNLCIRYYDKDEMEITGCFDSVSFE